MTHTLKEFRLLQRYEKGLFRLHILNTVIPILFTLMMFTWFRSFVLMDNMGKSFTYLIVAMIIQVIMFSLIKLRKTLRTRLHKLVRRLCEIFEELNEKELHDKVGHDDFWTV